MSSIRRYPAKSAVIGGLILLVLIIFMAFLLPGKVVLSAPNATFTVNNSGDAADPDLDDSLCDTNLATIAIRECTLRAAIQQSNVLDSHDTITFDNVVVIAPLSELPALTNDYGVTIDGNGSVFLSGLNAGNSAGLTLDSNNNRVVGMIIFGFADGVIVTGQNNVIGTDGDGVDDAAERNVIYSNQCTGCTGYGIQLSGSNNIVAGNYVGVTTNGEDSGPNKIGVYIDGDGNRIGTDGDGISDTTERNVISGNSQHGIDISGDNNVVAGNYIGLKKDGDEAQPNSSSGIAVDVLAAHTLIGTNSDGDGDVGERNIISGNGSNGITNQGDYTVVAGNYVGTNALGTSAISNGGYGIVVTYSSYDVQIGTNGDGTLDHLEGNTISGNTLGGVAVTNVNDGTWIAGNKIGTNPGGTAEIANQGDGVYAEGGDASNLLIGTNGDGTADVIERNIISGNGQDGIHLSLGLRYAVVAGNHIGTDVNGTTAFGNGVNGVLIDGGSDHNLIGTDADGASDTLERNLISGNVQAGVRIEGDNSDSNAVAGNYIGTNASGNAALGNNIGVRVDDQAAQTIIGPSTNPDLGNVISGNSGDGIFIGDNCDTTVVQYNVIGRNYLASAALGNNRNGIYLTAGAFDSNIYANTIASNSGAGIFMASSAGVGNYYEDNRIYSNGGLGVDLAPIGVTPNDLGDGDIGPNNLMNFPEFRLLVIHDDEILIEGVINSEPNETIPIRVYQVQSCDPSGYGEGGGSVGNHYTTGESTTTDANGNGVFVSAVGGYDPTIPYVVMSTGYSEFSECKLVEAASSAAMAELSIGDASLLEGDSGSTWMEFDITLDRAATITVTLSYGLVESSAKFGEDFVQDWGEISFPPGTTEQTLSVEILGDAIAEPDEIFYVNIHSPVGARIPGDQSQATGTIWDDDGGGGSWLFLPLIIR